MTDNKKFNNSGNVLDKYKNMSTEAIRKELKKNALPFAPLMMQIAGDFNFSTLVRNANAFMAQEAFYYGPRKKWDKRGDVGCRHYTPVNYLSSIQEIEALRSTYPHFVAMEILPGVSQPMSEHEWKPGTLLFFGEEGQGLAPEILDMCDDILHIEQGGSVRSVNVGTASGIALHDIMTQLTKDNKSILEKACDYEDERGFDLPRRAEAEDLLRAILDKPHKAIKYISELIQHHDKK